MKRFAILLHLSALLSLFIYSFSQIDLNLTLSSNPLYQFFQQQLIHLGYFNRPLSTFIYLSLLVLLFTSYFLILSLASKKLITSEEIIKLGIVTAAVLLFSYPAFSHDIFNYIFDARIFVLHHANPFTHTALDFPADLWTRFMRWTHRTYPYGPTWLPITLVFYLAGFNKFVPTLLSFKFLGALSYLLSIFSLKSILKSAKSKHQPVTLALFAFNPLIIIESLVSSHIDAVMAALMLASLALFLNKRKTLSWFALVVSAGTKYVTLGLAPFLFLLQKSKINLKKALEYALITIYLLTIVIISQREILPWYFISPFALTSLFPKKTTYLLLMFGLSIGLLLRYAPFIYIGDYTPWVKSTRNLVTLAALALPFAYLFGIKKSRSSSSSR